MSCDPFVCPWCGHESRQNEESFEIENPRGSVFVCERCFDADLLAERELMEGATWLT